MGQKWGCTAVNKMELNETTQPTYYTARYRHGWMTSGECRFGEVAAAESGTELTLILWPKAKKSRV